MMVSSTAVKVMLWVLLFLFCLAFLRCLRQNPPLSDEDYMLPIELFPPNPCTSWAWTYWNDFCWRTGTKIMITLQPPPTSVSLGKMKLSSHSCTLRSEFISWWTLNLRDTQLILIKFPALGSHNLGAPVQHGLVLTECLLRKRCIFVAKITWKDKSVITFATFTKIIQHLLFLNRY